MEIKTSDYLESRVYRILFEYIKSSKNAIHQLIGLMESIYTLPNREFLIYQMIVNRRNCIDELMDKNKDVINYLRDYDLESYKSSLFSKLIMNEDLLKVLKKIRDDKSLIDGYLKNAKRLEALNVEKIVFGDISKLMREFHHYYYEIKT